VTRARWFGGPLLVLLAVLAVPAVAAAAPAAPPTTAPGTTVLPCNQRLFDLQLCERQPVTVPRTVCTPADFTAGQCVLTMVGIPSDAPPIPSFGLGGLADCASNPLGCIAKGMLGWATGILGDVTRLVQKGLNAPDLSSASYRALYGRMELVALFVAFAAFMVSIAGNRTNRSRLMATARLAGAAAIVPNVPWLVTLAYGAVGEATSIISAGFGGDLRTITSSMSAALSNLGPTSIGLSFFVSVFVVLSSLLVLVDLVLLAVIVSITTAFVPIVAAFAVAEAGISTLKRLVVTLVGAVAGGFVIAGCGAVGAALLAAAGTDTLVSLLTGTVVLFLTGVAPFVLMGILGMTVGLHRRHVAVPAAVGAAAAAKGLAVVA
jgi:hypothetical protein